jgi:hypothetical protein
VRTPATPGQSWDIHADRGAAVTQRLNARMGSTQLTMRSREEIAGYFDGLDLVDPGLVSVPHWRPVIEPAGLLNAYAGMGRNPWSTNRVLAGSTLPVQPRQQNVLFADGRTPGTPPCEGRCRSHPAPPSRKTADNLDYYGQKRRSACTPWSARHRGPTPSGAL